MASPDRRLTDAAAGLLLAAATFNRRIVRSAGAAPTGDSS